MGRSGKAPKGGGRGGRDSHHSRGRGGVRSGGIVKNSHNSSSEALGRAIAAARTAHGGAGASGSLHLAFLSENACEEEETTVEQLLDLVRECAVDAGSAGMALTALGDRVRNLAVRRGLHSLHKQVKDKWGGLEAFIRAHAARELIVAAGVVRACPPPPAAGEMAVEPHARTAEAAPTSGDVNALSLDAAAL